MDKLSGKAGSASRSEADVRLTLAELSQPLRQSLEALGISELTEIQQRSLPPAIEGRDILAMSYTGSGKTLAFGIPVVQRLKSHGSKGPRALILAPTRELAMQVEVVFRDTFRQFGLKSLVVTGGASYGLQRQALNRKVDIVVGTPGRIVDLIDQGILDLAVVETFVLDEVDQMLDIGFADALEKIRGHLPDTIQTLFFSATMPPPIMRLARRLLKNPAEVMVGGAKKGAPLITHHYCEVLDSKRVGALVNCVLGENPQQAIIFCRTKAECSEVGEGLMRHGLSAGKLNSDMSQNERTDTLNRFRNQTLRFLVATDVAARGIDIKDLPLVVNFTVPQNPDSYTHRSGRTGRAGLGGKALTLVSADEGRSFVFLMQRLGIQPERMYVPEQNGILKAMIDRLLSPVSSEAALMGQVVSQLVAEKVEGMSTADCRDLVTKLLEAQMAQVRVYAASDLSPRNTLVHWQRADAHRGGGRDGSRGSRFGRRPPGGFSGGSSGSGRAPFRRDRDAPRDGAREGSRGGQAPQSRRDGGRPFRGRRPQDSSK